MEARTALDPGSERAPLPEALARPPRGRVLVLAPHTDDEVIGAGGTCALHVAQGDPVSVIVAYDGIEGDPERRFERAELIALRQRESRAGGAHLGLKAYEFLGHPEGHVPGPAALLAGARSLAERVRALEVDTVYAPWIGEHHLDHHVLARAVRLALALAGFRGAAWGYEVWTPLVPTRIVDVSAVHARKEAALREHRSQLSYHDLVTKGLALSRQRAMYLAKEAQHGEAFAPLGAPFGCDAELLAR
jgi:LmbE family N-acetylglucosaminyl deacetylase